MLIEHGRVGEGGLVELVDAFVAELDGVFWLLKITVVGDLDLEYLPPDEEDEDNP